jgi:hypothetical protein
MGFAALSTPTVKLSFASPRWGSRSLPRCGSCATGFPGPPWSVPPGATCGPRAATDLVGIASAE